MQTSIGIMRGSWMLERMELLLFMTERACGKASIPKPLLRLMACDAGLYDGYNPFDAQDLPLT